MPNRRKCARSATVVWRASDEAIWSARRAVNRQDAMIWDAALALGCSGCRLLSKSGRIEIARAVGAFSVRQHNGVNRVEADFAVVMDPVRPSIFERAHQRSPIACNLRHLQRTARRSARRPKTCRDTLEFARYMTDLNAPDCAVPSPLCCAQRSRRLQWPLFARSRRSRRRREIR